MLTITEMAERIQHLLGTEAERLGRETGFIQRERVLNGAQFAQTLVFGWMSNWESTLSELSQTAGMLGVSISKQGLNERFGPKAVAFMRALLDKAVSQIVEGDSAEMQLVERFKAVHIIDSTTIQLPDELAKEWSGCGGREASRAALKISVDWDVRHGGLHGVCLSPGRTHDQRAPIAAGNYAAGSLRLADIGYFNLQTFRRLDNQGVYWVTRLKSNVTLYTPDGQRLAWVDLLKHTSQNALELSVLVGAERLPARWCARRLTPQAVTRRQTQLNERARKKQRPISADTQTLAYWAVSITNVPIHLLTFEEVMVLVRLRWQIELLFKLWKSQAHLDEWRTTNPWRLLCEIYAKLLALLIQHWLIVLSTWTLPDRSLYQAFQVLRKYAWHFACSLTCRSTLIHALTLIARTLSACRMSTLRNEPHTFQRIALPTAFA